MADDKTPEDEPSEDRPLHKRHIWEFQALRDILMLLAAYGLLYLGYVLQTVTVPMLVALGLAYLIEPMVKRTSKRYKWATRPRVVVSFLVVLTLSLGLLISVIVPVALAQTVNLARNGGNYFDAALRLSQLEVVPEFIRKPAARFGEAFGRDIDGEPATAIGEAAQELSSELDAIDGQVDRPAAPAAEDTAATAVAISEERIRELVIEEMAHQRQQEQSEGGLLGLAGRVSRAVMGVVSQVTTGFVGFVFSVFLTGFFFLVFSTSWPEVIRFFDEHLPTKYADRTRDLAGQMDAAVSGFVRGRLLITLILCGVYGIGWTICGVPYGLILGICIGIFTIVPYLSGIGLPIAWLLLVMHVAGVSDGDSFYLDATGKTVEIIWWRVLLFPGLIFVLAQTLDDYVLTPTIQGKATNLSPSVVMVAVIAGGSLAGLYGMLLAIPFAACLRIVIVEVLWPQITAWLRGERSDPLPLKQD